MKTKITRKLLKNYRKTVCEIPLLEMELKEMRGRGQKVEDIHESCFSQESSSFDMEKYEMRRKALDRKKDEAMAVKEWIEAIEDGQTRCVFRMYYLDGNVWAKVARAAGYGGNEDYPRRYIRDKYLNECGIK